ncbi:MAG: hypothetical protein CM1200mP12_03970 [Gammaproteobacteria bacterium]|nr:MAG: hypothetical protein CM1200mP12_03970 [Gammaproteobacteria bacterium]
MIETIKKLIGFSSDGSRKGRDPTPEELGERMELPEDKIRRVLRLQGTYPH